MSRIDQNAVAISDPLRVWAFQRAGAIPELLAPEILAPELLAPELLAERPEGLAAEGAGPRAFYRQRGKRVFDVLFILIGLPAILPMVLILALLVMRDGGRPFFGHLRIGRDGRPFRCWKLRSMVPDAQAHLARHLARDPAARAEWEAGCKLERDPRITRLGHFLRRSSLDELPQAWNILRGEMSVVGPRPVVGDELARYGAGLRHYQALRPGLTGLWQVSGRNGVSYGERVALDMAYARNHTFGMDLAIILATVRSVLLRTGK